MVNTQIRSLTSADYYQMMESGIIREGERVELILGQIFTMAAKGTRHTVATTRLITELPMLLQRRAIVRCQEPITLPNDSEPEPDIAIVRLRSDDYINSHPSPADVILVIEVADSTIKFDRDTKAPLYAAVGINEYWIINLIDDRLEIYRQPEGNIYTSIEIILPPRSINLPGFPEIVLSIDDFFPVQKA
ncbi:Uma2 family endonuclease [Chamaesiphon sp. VAR_69_metabat_338]|uniref:Uma2 family endonuclease n=1 Tax=Chamaesiphon sp. VAR_69_metabat_338 TaxID=2964704 RepID=UPI00286DE831|nr:Uma2 family endonuclease [Chamaesiphon sp. VAR_69_metabat_338]